jgi:hypothetical protein
VVDRRSVVSHGLDGRWSWVKGGDEFTALRQLSAPPSHQPPPYVKLRRLPVGEFALLGVN